MRKWLAAGAALLLIPWAMSLMWMGRAGAAKEAKADTAGSGIGWETGDGGFDAEAELSAGSGSILEADGSRNGAGSDLKADLRTDLRTDLEAEPGADLGADGTEEAASSGAGQTGYRILMERDGTATYLDLEDYLPGVIVCQISPDQPMEALKCQAVIARTYIRRLMDGRTEIHEEELDLDYLGGGAGSLPGRASMTQTEREALAVGLSRCRQAAEETAGVVMTEEGRCILPLFHAMSAGRTRTGDSAYPYLQSVESRWDGEREGFRQEFAWSREEFARLVSQMGDQVPVSASQIAGQIQTIRKDDAGYLEEIKIGPATFSGETLQYALGLPSACIQVEETEDEIRIVTRGAGHGYGLSQAGAASMAEEGWDYPSILQYYYKNISLTSE